MAVAEEVENEMSLPRLEELINTILFKTSETKESIEEIRKIIKYQDVLYFTWKTLAESVSAIDNSDDAYMLNTLELLQKITIYKNFNAGKKKNLGISPGSKKFTVKLSVLKKFEGNVWQSLINRDFSLKVHKKLLFVLIDKYLSKLSNPLFLTDFLMSSLNIKGAVAVFALQGIATLMQKHNIEYPNIYAKLYTMFEPSIFHFSYKARLFNLANIFLTSTYLPEAMVASFAKRISHLILSCSAPDIVIILKFVGNLLKRHEGLKRMINYQSDYEVSEDPFIVTENDPMKTRAIESSLWEIALLRNHCQPTVCMAAKFIKLKISSLEFDLNEVLGNSYQKMFETECQKKQQTVSLTFERPQESVAKLSDDRLFKMWSLTE